MPATAGPALPLSQGIRTGRRGAAVSSGGRFVLQCSDTGKEDPDQDIHLLQCRADRLPVTGQTGLLQQLQGPARNAQLGQGGAELVRELLRRGRTLRLPVPEVGSRPGTEQLLRQMAARPVLREAPRQPEQGRGERQQAVGHVRAAALPVSARAGGVVFVLGSPCCVLCGCLHKGLNFDFCKRMRSFFTFFIFGSDPPPSPQPEESSYFPGIAGWSE